MHAIDPAVQAFKDITRHEWMLHFEAIATVGNDEDSLAWGGAGEEAHGRRIQ